MKNYRFIIPALIPLLLFSCTEKRKADGYGNFEATEIIVSSEANGRLEFLNVEEGQIIEPGTAVGLVDTIQLHLTKMQLIASKQTVHSQLGGIDTQIAVLNEELKNAQTEQRRIQNMYSENAATRQQLDEADSRVSVLKKKIENVRIQDSPVMNEMKAIDAKVNQISEQIEQSKIVNPVSGTVLTKYAEAGEIVAFGKPLYKIADLSDMTLRVYVGQTQLPSLKIGQKVTVKIDDGKSMKSFPGTVSWISSSAEFTPKIIQTKEERVNLVYAVKISVKNDGSLKIGMPAEMWINPQKQD